MDISLFPAQRKRVASDQPDCGLGHSCQFCPRQSECTLDKPRHEKLLIEGRLDRIDQIVMVMANKGGVGKSTMSANLAAGLAARGYRVGVADADVHGPNESRFFGFVGAHVRLGKQGLPTCDFKADALKHPIKVGSLAFLMESDDTPIVWRDAYKHDFMHHLIGSFDWGELDFLILDMPPGTGNELITLTDMLEGTNLSALLATTSQDVALMDSLKAVRFCQERGLPMLGVIENMAAATCPHCHGSFQLFPREHLEAQLDRVGVPVIAKVPLDPHLALGSDRGLPEVLARPDGPVAAALAPSSASRRPASAPTSSPCRSRCRASACPLRWCSSSPSTTSGSRASTTAPSAATTTPSSPPRPPSSSTGRTTRLRRRCSARARCWRSA